LSFSHLGGDALFVLTPDPDGDVGAITLTPADGAGTPITLDTAGAATRFDFGRFLPVYTLDAAGIDRAFDTVVAAEPVPPARFLLYFETGTATLTPESAGDIDRILAAIADRDSRDIAITGHADRAGSDAANYQISIRRAQAVSNTLVDAGIPRDSLDLTSHGEANPIVPTADGVAEPRNRRVEVIVR